LHTIQAKQRKKRKNKKKSKMNFYQFYSSSSSAIPVLIKPLLPKSTLQTMDIHSTGILFQFLTFKEMTRFVMRLSKFMKAKGMDSQSKMKKKYDITANFRTTADNMAALLSPLRFHLNKLDLNLMAHSPGSSDVYYSNLRGIIYGHPAVTHVKLSNIEEVASRFGCTDFTMRYFFMQLQDSYTLHSLTLNGNSHTPMQSLFSPEFYRLMYDCIVKNQTLEVLHILNNHFMLATNPHIPNNPGYTLFYGLLSHSSLKVLCLNEINFKGIDLRPLVKLIKENPLIESLSLARCSHIYVPHRGHYPDAEAWEWTEEKQEAYFEEKRAEYDSVHSIFDAIGSSKTLKRVDMSSINFARYNHQIRYMIKQKPALVYLNLSECKNLECEGLFPFLEFNESITELNLSGCCITSDGLESICGVITHNRTLKILDLSRNRLGTNYISVLGIMQMISYLNEHLDRNISTLNKLDISGDPGLSSTTVSSFKVTSIPFVWTPQNRTLDIKKNYQEWLNRQNRINFSMDVDF